MNAPTDHLPLIADELDLLASLVPLEGLELIELGCGDARLARALVARHPGTRMTALEVDARQHARNLASPAAGIRFVHAGAEAIPAPAASFDGALMLKSLHHVPLARLAQALSEVARVLRPGGWLYVSEPVYAGALNEIVRLFNDEREVRAAAQHALDDAVRADLLLPQAECRFETPARFRDFADFEQRIVRPSWADHAIDDALLAAVRARFEAHAGPDGAAFNRPMHVRLFRRAG
jgi:ubiquinone/menaquinone biosynthesis C-methylase UbiE